MNEIDEQLQAILNNLCAGVEVPTDEESEAAAAAQED
tara:strand:+ start:75 stop:185 length:111 start_codon:yes stop_codon:yes gene_type:complete